GASRSAFAVFRAFLFGPVAHHHVTGGRAVMDWLAADGEGALGHARSRLFLLVLLILVAILGVVLRRRGCVRSGVLVGSDFQFARDRLAGLGASQRRDAKTKNGEERGSGEETERF